MKVLVACEFSGIVRDAFTKRGHDAWSCDLLPTEKPGNHIQRNVLDLLGDLRGSQPVSQIKRPSKYPIGTPQVPSKFDLMIAHPPCTYLTNSGVCWLNKKEGRWELMRRGAAFFNQLLNAPISKIAIENPIPHRYAIEIIGRKADQIIQPWMFGSLETKATCLWLKGLPKLTQTNNNLLKDDGTYEKLSALPDNVRQRLHYLPPSENRQKERSRTFYGIADAMADQWG